MQKQTRLDDDALIYQPRKKQTEKEKLREMKLKDKIDYIWEYYRLPIILVVVALALAAYFIYGLLHPAASTQFYAAMINNSIDNEVLNEYSTEFSERLKLDPKKEIIELNTNYVFQDDTQNQYSMSMKEALITYVSAKEIDVIIAPESQFNAYSYNGFFSKLSDKLPTDVYSSLTDQFYMSGTEDDAEKNAYGIYLTNTKLYKNNADNTDPYILGIVGNSQHEENVIEFIRFLFEDK